MRIELKHIKAHEAVTKIGDCRNEPIVWLYDDIYLNKGEDTAITRMEVKLRAKQINRS